MSQPIESFQVIWSNNGDTTHNRMPENKVKLIIIVEDENELLSYK